MKNPMIPQSIGNEPETKTMLKALVMGLALSLGLALVAVKANAQSNSINQVWSGNTGTYYAGWRLDYNFDQSTYVERILVSATGRQNFSLADVYADGELVGRLGVPGVDPDYPVVIRKKIRSISIRFSGTVSVSDFKIYGKQNANWGSEQEDDQDLNVTSSDSVAELAAKASDAVNFLQERMSQETFNKYLKPIRKTAILLEAAAMGRNSTSGFTIRKAVNLINALKLAEPMIENMMSNRYYNQSALALLTVKEALERKYEIEVVTVKVEGPNK